MSGRWLALVTAVFVAANGLASCERATTSAAAEGAASGPSAARAYELIRERPAPDTGVTSVSAVIGLQGGSLTLDAHTLEVPRGAVAVPTRFTLRAVPNGFLEVEATARVERLIGGALDIGAQGFHRPVTLTLSYADGANVPADPAALVVVQRRGGYAGSFQRVPSTTDPARKIVTAQLRHFSGSVLAAN